MGQSSSFHTTVTSWTGPSAASLRSRTGPSPKTSAATATTRRRLESTPMGRKQVETCIDRCANAGSLMSFRRLQLKISLGVQWYNFRPYVPRTFNSKITDLPHLWNATERKCYTLPGLWHRNHHE